MVSPARETAASRAMLLYFAAVRDDKRPIPYSESAFGVGALGGTRTPNLLIRSQMLYPLSYERTAYEYTAAGRLPVRVDVTRTGAGLTWV